MARNVIIPKEQNEIKENAKILGKNIRKFREAKKINRIKFAMDMEVTESTVCKWENGDSSPRMALFGKICKYFEVSPNEMFGYEKVQNKNGNIYIGNLTEEDQKMVYGFILRLSR